MGPSPAPKGKGVEEEWDSKQPPGWGNQVWGNGANGDKLCWAKE